MRTKQPGDRRSACRGTPVLGRRRGHEVALAGRLAGGRRGPAVAPLARAAPRGVTLYGGRLLPRGCPPPICRRALCAIQAVGRLAGRQRCPAVSAAARVGHGRGLWSSTNTFTFEGFFIMVRRLAPARRSVLLPDC